MRIILTMAISANGIIATKSGNEDFLSDQNWYRFVKLAKSVGSFICGRKTYEAMMQWEGDYMKDIEGVKKIVVSSSEFSLKDGFELASSPEDAIEKLEAYGFDQVLISGGAKLNSTFAKNNLIDEVILSINPIIMGEGISVFSPDMFQLSMNLVSIEKIDNNIVELRYKVQK